MTVVNISARSIRENEVLSTAICKNKSTGDS